MKTILKLSILGLLSLSSFTYGQDVTKGNARDRVIDELYCYNTNSCFVVFNEFLDKKAGCAGNGGLSRRALTVDISTDSGKSIYSTALAAFMGAKKISIYGDGTCAGRGNYAVENVFYIQMKR
ncbi:MAG: hypothetical protein HRU19_32300 [Pseudobacteriovorax sp.]|nr:hypothetical protein [Pseudobacteriovorax sp.]